MKVRNEEPLAVKDAGFGLGVTQKFVSSANATGGIDLTDAPETGKRVAIIDLFISTNTAMIIYVRMETSGNNLAAFALAANSTLVFSPRAYLRGDAVDKKIRLVTSVSGIIGATVTYFSED